MAARKQPITKVTLMTLFIFMPMSWLVSKSFDTARMAMPTVVWFMISMSTITRRIVSTGVMSVTSFVVAPIIVTDLLSTGMDGYI